VNVCVRDLHSICACSEIGPREDRTLLAGASEMRLVCTAKPCDVLKVKKALLQRVCYAEVFTFYPVVTKYAG
jgi:hypothetical protein